MSVLKTSHVGWGWGPRAHLQQQQGLQGWYKPRSGQPGITTMAYAAHKRHLEPLVTEHQESELNSFYLL